MLPFRPLRRCHPLVPVALVSAALLMAVCGAVRPARAQQITFTPLGDLIGGDFYSEAYGVSGDGKVVVGHSEAGAGVQAFRWENGGMAGIGALFGGGYSGAYGVSADGQIVVGYSDSAEGEQAFRWQNGTMTGLGLLSGGLLYSEATGISADGKVIIGGSDTNSGSATQAFRWENGQMSGLGTPAGSFPSNFSSGAYGVSTDGKAVSGRFQAQAFRWQSGVMSLLAGLPGGASSGANALSGDGKVAVGYSGSSQGERAVRWDGNGQIANLGVLAGYIGSYGNGVSGDGTVAVGEDYTAAGVITAFLWRSDRGMVDLKSLALAGGATGLNGWTLESATAISSDGSAIIGNGTNAAGKREAFLLRATNPGGFRTLSPAAGAVLGRLILQGLANAAAPRAVTFEFRPQGGGAVVTRTQTIGAGVSEQPFALQVPLGQYTLAIKGAQYLRQTIQVDLSGAEGVAVPDVTLLAGDVSGDNRVNLTDLVQLRANYGKTGANLTGDLNGDGRVNLTDLVLLRGNYGKNGAP